MQERLDGLRQPCRIMVETLIFCLVLICRLYLTFDCSRHGCRHLSQSHFIRSTFRNVQTGVVVCAAVWGTDCGNRAGCYVRERIQFVSQCLRQARLLLSFHTSYLISLYRVCFESYTCRKGWTDCGNRAGSWWKRLLRQPSTLCIQLIFCLVLICRLYMTFDCSRHGRRHLFQSHFMQSAFCNGRTGTVVCAAV